MKKLEMKNYKIILIEKQQKYRHYHQEQLINMNITEFLLWNSVCKTVEIKKKKEIETLQI